VADCGPVAVRVYRLHSGRVVTAGGERIELDLGRLALLVECGDDGVDGRVPRLVARCVEEADRGLVAVGSGVVIRTRAAGEGESCDAGGRDDREGAASSGTRHCEAHVISFDGVRAGGPEMTIHKIENVY